MAVFLAKPVPKFQVLDIYVDTKNLMRREGWGVSFGNSKHDAFGRQLVLEFKENY